MRLWGFIKFMFGLTVLALIYIHMQMNIFSLAYDGKQKEQKIVQLQENNGRVSNNIFELKSASYLGRKMLKEDAKLRFYDGKSVVKLVSKKKSSTQKLAANQNKKTNPLSKIFTWHFPSVAHAEERQSKRPWERENR